MISANELRLGNWVTYKSDPVLITAIGEFGIQSDAYGRHINAKFATPDIEPIPLSPALLERCGFERPYSWRTHSYVLDRLQIEIDSLRAYLLPEYEDGGEWYYIPGECQYLHQLQNMFFAICGTELKITL